MHIWAATLCLQTASGPAQCDSGAFCKSALSPAFSFVFNRSFAIDCNGNKGGWRASISEYTWAPEQRSECPLLPILAIDVGTAKKGEAHTVKQHYAPGNGSSLGTSVLTLFLTQQPLPIVAVWCVQGKAESLGGVKRGAGQISGFCSRLCCHLAAFFWQVI